MMTAGGFSLSKVDESTLKRFSEIGLLTRRDYQLIADSILEAESLGIFTTKRKGQYANLVADRLVSTNPAFNRYLFLKACGVLN